MVRAMLRIPLEPCIEERLNKADPEIISVTEPENNCVIKVMGWSDNARANNESGFATSLDVSLTVVNASICHELRGVSDKEKVYKLGTDFVHTEKKADRA